MSADSTSNNIPSAFQGLELGDVHEETLERLYELQDRIEKGKNKSALRAQVQRALEKAEERFPRFLQEINGATNINDDLLNRLASYSDGVQQGLPNDESQKVYRTEVVSRMIDYLGGNANTKLDPQQSSKLLEKVMAQLVSGDKSADKALFYAMRMVQHEDFIPDDIKATFLHKWHRKELAQEMEKNGEDGVTIDENGIIHTKKGDFQIERFELLTGATMQKLDTRLLGEFRLKNLIFKDDGLILFQMENGCQGNFGCGKITKVPPPPEKPESPTEEPESPTEEPESPTEEPPPPPEEPPPPTEEHPAEEFEAPELVYADPSPHVLDDQVNSSTLMINGVEVGITGDAAALINRDPALQEAFNTLVAGGVASLPDMQAAVTALSVAPPASTAHDEVAKYYDRLMSALSGGAPGSLEDQIEGSLQEEYQYIQNDLIVDAIETHIPIRYKESDHTVVTKRNEVMTAIEEIVTDPNFSKDTFQNILNAKIVASSPGSAQERQFNELKDTYNEISAQYGFTQTEAATTFEEMDLNSDVDQLTLANNYYDQMRGNWDAFGIASSVWNAFNSNDIGNDSNPHLPPTVKSITASVLLKHLEESKKQEMEDPAAHLTADEIEKALKEDKLPSKEEVRAQLAEDGIDTNAEAQKRQKPDGSFYGTLDELVDAVHENTKKSILQHYLLDKYILDANFDANFGVSGMPTALQAKVQQARDNYESIRDNENILGTGLSTRTFIEEGLLTAVSIVPATAAVGGALRIGRVGAWAVRGGRVGRAAKLVALESGIGGTTFGAVHTGLQVGAYGTEVLGENPAAKVVENIAMSAFFWAVMGGGSRLVTAGAGRAGRVIGREAEATQMFNAFNQTTRIANIEVAWPAFFNVAKRLTVDMVRPGAQSRLAHLGMATGATARTALDAAAITGITTGVEEVMNILDPHGDNPDHAEIRQRFLQSFLMMAMIPMVQRATPKSTQRGEFDQTRFDTEIAADTQVNALQQKYPGKKFETVRRPGEKGWEYEVRVAKEVSSRVNIPTNPRPEQSLISGRPHQRATETQRQAVRDANAASARENQQQSRTAEPSSKPNSPDARTSSLPQSSARTEPVAPKGAPETAQPRPARAPSEPRVLLREITTPDIVTRFKDIKGKSVRIRLFNKIPKGRSVTIASETQLLQFTRNPDGTFSGRNLLTNAPIPKAQLDALRGGTIERGQSLSILPSGERVWAIKSHETPKPS